MGWADSLQEASLDGIRFPVSSRKVTYSRDGARIRLPYVDGQDVEDTGRNPRTYVLAIPLFPTVEGLTFDDADNIRERLTALAEDERSLTQVEYVDPIHGAIDVRIWSCSEDTSGDELDGCRLLIEMEELTFESTGTLIVRRSAERDALEAARAVDDAIANSEDITEEQAADAVAQSGNPQTPQQVRARRSGALMESVWENFRDGISEAAMAVDEATARVDAVRARIDAVLRLPNMGTAGNWPLYSSLLVMLDAVGRYGDERVASAVPVVRFEVRGAESVYDIAARLYGDTTRAEEIMRRNSIRTPFAVPRGMILRVAQR